MHDGRVRPIERRRVTVEVKQEDGSLAAEHREYETTDLGPVIHRTNDRVFVVRLSTWSGCVSTRVSSS